MFRFNVVHKTISLPNATAVDVQLPQGSKEHYFACSDTSVELRWSTNADVVTSGGGVPIQAGSGFSILGPVHGTTLRFFHNGGKTVNLEWAYLQPNVR